MGITFDTDIAEVVRDVEKLYVVTPLPDGRYQFQRQSTFGRSTITYDPSTRTTVWRVERNHADPSSGALTRENDLQALHQLRLTLFARAYNLTDQKPKQHILTKAA